MTKAQTQELTEQAVAQLRSLCPPGQLVYTSLAKVSPSGMSRVINLHTIANVTHRVRQADGSYTDETRPELVWLTGYVARFLGLPRTEAPEGLRVRGCGMDMGFAVVYELAQALHGDGYALEHKWA